LNGEKRYESDKITFCLVVGLLVAGTSLSIAQVPASQPVIQIPGGAANAGLLEAAINGDTNAAGARIHQNRLYSLTKNTIYITNCSIMPMGTLMIVREKDGTKPIIIMVRTGAAIY
jgi:hypothetical protein